MAYATDVVQEVWETGKTVSDNDPRIWRKDECGAWMQRSMYSDRNSQYGWEIARIAPGGPDALPNLRPLQWMNGICKSDGSLKCNVTAVGVDNKELTDVIHS
jgi:hypothetical protein